MTTFGKRASLLLGASALAIAVAAAPSPSKAFNVVDWQWTVEFEETITKTVEIDIDLEPTGLVKLENIQINVGDVTALSVVDDVNNNQPASAGGDVVIDLGHMFWEHSSTNDGANSQNDFKVDYVFDPDQPGVVSYDPIALGVDNNTTGLAFNAAGDQALGTITVSVTPSDAFNALTELPEVVSAATAVANNSNVSSDVAVEMHEGQFAFGTFNGVDVAAEDGSALDLLAAVGLADLVVPTGNRHHDVLVVMASLAQMGLIQQGNVDAASFVTNIENATVDSSATAVVNNKSISVDAVTPDDALVIADVTQFGYMNSSATSLVAGVDLNSYTNLGILDRPIVSSVATAVGNNLNINVSSPNGVVQP